MPTDYSSKSFRSEYVYIPAEQKILFRISAEPEFRYITNKSQTKKNTSLNPYLTDSGLLLITSIESPASEFFLLIVPSASTELSVRNVLEAFCMYFCMMSSTGLLF